MIQHIDSDISFASVNSGKCDEMVSISWKSMVFSLMLFDHLVNKFSYELVIKYFVMDLMGILSMNIVHY